MLRFVPWLMLAILVGPVATGLTYIVGPAFGYAPLFGLHDFSLSAFENAIAEPGMIVSLWLGYWIGPVTALISVALVALFVASFSGTRFFASMLSALKPVIAMPHAAAAFGLAFLIAPSGFLIRLISPELTGFSRPPDWLVINDPAGWSLLFGLVVKEIPFVFLVVVAALPQADPRRLRVARALGYGRVWAWMTAVFPSVYAQIRLPVYAVVAFASSVVDVALILGPGTPPPVSVRILRWMNDPDLSARLIAAAAAIMQLGVTLAALATWWAIERFIANLGLRIAVQGQRFRNDGILRMISGASVFSIATMMLLGIGLLTLWSLSGLWRFPDALPKAITLKTWMREAHALIPVAGRTLFIGIAASFMAITLAIACLENETRHNIKLAGTAKLALYLPLLVPQIAFLFGLSVWMLRLGLDGKIWSVIFAHLVFVLPYVYLLLADPWHAFDKRYLDIARLLNKTENMVLFTIRLPILLRPILTAFALGFAISAAQYLPTLLIGAGRHPTITTEAVALASGGNRRLIGSYALVQTALPFLMFALTALIPTILWRNRRALRPGFGR